MQLSLKGDEIGVLFVLAVGATDVEQGVVGSRANDGVDVSVGVVAHQGAVVEPNDSVGPQSRSELFVDLLPSERLIAMRSQKTL